MLWYLALYGILKCLKFCWQTLKNQVNFLEASNQNILLIFLAIIFLEWQPFRSTAEWFCFLFFYCDHLPILTGFLSFWFLGWVSLTNWGRLSHSSEGLVASTSLNFWCRLWRGISYRCFQLRNVTIACYCFKTVAWSHKKN